MGYSVLPFHIRSSAAKRIMLCVGFAGMASAVGFAFLQGGGALAQAMSQNVAAEMDAPVASAPASALPPADPAVTANMEGVPDIIVGTPPSGDPAPASASPGTVTSLLFSPEEVRLLRNAIEVYMKNASGQVRTDGSEDFIKQLEGLQKTDGQEKYYTYPQFFLESLVYNGPHDWSVRLNGQKLSPSKAAERLPIRVLSVDKQKVTLEWTPSDMARVNEAWKRGGGSQDVYINRTTRTVIFTLQHNQTFSSYAMRVLEGKVQPITVENQMLPPPEELPADPSAAPSSVMPMQPQHPPHQSYPSTPTEGLGGLLDRYQHLNQRPIP